eukprot:CAMPEP_0182800744 /NCGR_PEP_ID=MMETSP0006_2-20121128/2578_1 /TAXON_ID=97485 /ORGANISM="Prymnesium parvum, Strain Texoma1" /LENGTH=32 /DNA_ID= /DNA_START= /DNA_END= /DNA_ORIENTATION=
MEAGLPLSLGDGRVSSGEGAKGLKSSSSSNSA